MHYALLSLLQLSDPALPIGGYSHSSGLETYVQQGIVKDVDTAREFVVQMLKQNIQYTDAALVSLSYEAASQQNFEQVIQLDELCNAVKLPSEVRMASQKLGTRLIKLFERHTNNAFAKRYQQAISTKEVSGHYCIAFGLYGFALGIKKEDLLNGFFFNAASGFVTNCVKLVPLGQKDGQDILFSLQGLISQMVTNTLHPDEEMIGVCCTGFDIRCMQHEGLYSRLYMS